MLEKIAKTLHRLMIMTHKKENLRKLEKELINIEKTMKIT